MANHAAALLELSDGQRSMLEKLSRSQTAPQRQVLRTKALLMAADGQANEHIAAAVGVSPTTVRAWRARFAEEGVARLGQVRKGRGPKPSITPAQVEQIVHDTLHARPKGETHWSTRSMARHAGVSRSTVARIWHARGLKPHLVDTFEVFTDAAFEDKLTDVVGLYVNPPENAIVLCMDEKSQVQALQRTQPSLPMTKGRAGTMTHDCKRNGTTTLLAALSVLTGVVIGQCLPAHRHEEFLKFLRTIDREVPKGLAVHLILDFSATHQRPDVQRWRARHKGFGFHFTPTSSSWLNLVERWFRELTDKALRRGSFNSVPDLIAAIEDYLAAHNDDPKPFKWTATADSILEKLRRGRVALQEAVNR